MNNLSFKFVILRNKQHRCLYRSWMQVAKSGSLRWVVHIAWMGKVRKAYGIFVRKLLENDYFLVQEGAR
jgi:hypothetical protein